MKYLMIVVLILIGYNASAQTLKENKVDEFTKNSVKRTSWEPIAKMGNIFGHVRGTKINNDIYLDMKVILNAGAVVAIKEGQVVMFKMSSDSILSINNPNHTVACRGCGSATILGSDGYGVELNLPISNDQVEYLTKNKITKIRIYTTDGFVESDIKERFQDNIKNVLLLIK